MEWALNSQTACDVPRGTAVYYIGFQRAGNVLAPPLARVSDCRPHRAPLAAVADGPVADTAETVAPQTGVVGAEPDGDDGHTVSHG